ncbi:THAP domain containing protein [Asbolus verrucosus]|uniref:THAP domain containing protein n=1 Tax=Asbolus verrucosus TaxID=1661398 RepID=A0A482VS59_ASBVE|nr:THAP domain containing protein [Asbolus verrucosus]
MGGCRCSYKNCTNTTKTRDNLHFFHYPVKQKDRCRQWIENANKPQFYDLDEDQLRNKVVCETHFEDCYFPNIQKKRLLQGAIPTLDGDCEQKTSHERIMKIQDVQVLPANADGTIFVLETNMQNSFQSERVESYIYTNNGLVLPISKCNETIDDSMQTIYSGSEVEEFEEPQIKLKNEQEVYETVTMEKDFDNYVFASESNLINEKVSQLQESKTQNSIKITDDIFSKTVGNKYVKKIKQHSKDIAILKRILKSKTTCRKPSNTIILNSLKRQVSSSLFSVINLNLNGNCELSSEDFEFFSTIYATSPQVYQILSQKYKWKLPNPELFNNSINKNNGHVYCEDN